MTTSPSNPETPPPPSERETRARIWDLVLRGETPALPDGSWEGIRGRVASELERRFVLPRSRGAAYEMIFGDDPWADYEPCPSNLHSIYPPYVLFGPGPSLASAGGVWYSPMRVWDLNPTSRASYVSAPAEAELAATLESLLDEAIDSATRTGTALDRLSQTFEAFHDWTTKQLGTRGDGT